MLWLSSTSFTNYIIYFVGQTSGVTRILTWTDFKEMTFSGILVVQFSYNHSHLGMSASRALR